MSLTKQCSNFKKGTCINPLSKLNNGFLNLDQFYKAKECKYGVGARCKECADKATIISRKKKPENIKKAKHKHYVKHANTIKAKRRKYVKENYDKVIESQKLYYENNKEYCLARNKKYVETHKQQVLVKQREWREENKATILLQANKRRASILNATPKWLNQDMWEQIQKLYIECTCKSQKSGIKYHVDHIIPLKAIDPKTKKHIACGLNVPWNLQIITASENLKKRNNLLSA